MFYRSYPVLTAYARPDSVAAPKAPGVLAERMQSNAMRAMNRELRAMRLSERLSDPAGYLRLQASRRQSLEALLTAPAEKAVLSRAVDIICMIAEESTWSENPALAPFEDEGRPEIDFQCAETAMLLAWVRRGMGPALDAISPRICTRMLAEVRRRVFAPFLAHGDYPFMHGRGHRPMGVLCDIVLTAILMETDANRRSAVIKQGLRFIDQMIGDMDGRKYPLPGPVPLVDFASEVAAITDFTLLVRRITRGELDLTGDYPAPEWLDALLFAWMEDDYFVDPAGDGLKPRMSGAELFRIGLAANDGALAALGADMERHRSEPSSTLTGRILDLNGAQLLAAENRKPPRIKHAAGPRNALMCSRFANMTFAIHTGGGQANAGDILIIAERRPIILGLKGYSSLPLIGSWAQQPVPDGACEADFRIKADRELMSVDLTRAYPAAAPVQSCQRTAMVMRAEGMMRIVDALELTDPAPVTFQFFTPECPRYQDGVVRLGPVDFAWEGELIYAAQALPATPECPGGLYRITLTTPESIAQAYYTFNIAASDGQMR